MKDWRGKAIKRGSSVVYPGRQGSVIWVVEAEVLEVKDEEIVVQPTRSTGDRAVSSRPVHIRNIDRVTVVG